MWCIVGAAICPWPSYAPYRFEASNTETGLYETTYTTISIICCLFWIAVDLNKDIIIFIRCLFCIAVDLNKDLIVCICCLLILFPVPVSSAPALRHHQQQYRWQAPCAGSNQLLEDIYIDLETTTPSHHDMKSSIKAVAEKTHKLNKKVSRLKRDYVSLLLYMQCYSAAICTDRVLTGCLTDIPWIPSFNGEKEDLYINIPSLETRTSASVEHVVCQHLYAISLEVQHYFRCIRFNWAIMGYYSNKHSIKQSIRNVGNWPWSWLIETDIKHCRRVHIWRRPQPCLLDSTVYGAFVDLVDRRWPRHTSPLWTVTSVRIVKNEVGLDQVMVSAGVHIYIYIYIYIYI